MKAEPKHMKQRMRFEMFGHTFEVYQGDGPAVILRVDDIYLVAQADEDANLVLPHHLMITNNVEAARDVCEIANHSGAGVPQLSAHLMRGRNGGDAA